MHPDQRERPRLTREVARRALADASRNGIVLEELMAALRGLGEGVELSDGTEEASR